MNAQTPRLSPNRIPHPPYHFRISTRRHPDTLRKHASLKTSYSVETFAILNEGNFEPRVGEIEGLDGVLFRGDGGVEVVHDSDGGGSRGAQCVSVLGKVKVSA